MTRIFCLALAFVCLTGCEKKRTPARYVIPANYEGAVITIFGQPGFPALPIKDGFQFHEYPADGILITSSPRELGQASDETLEVMKDGTYRQLSTGNGAGLRERYSEYGTQEGGGYPKFDYNYKVIGTANFTHDGTATMERDRKVSESLRNLKPMQEPASEPQR